MAFSDSEKVRLRHALGYANVGQVETFSLGFPTAVETQFLIEGAMNRVLPEAESKCRDILATLESVESQMMGDTELLAVLKIGEIEVNPKEQGALRGVYRYWQATLGNLLMIPPCPFDQRFMFGAGGISVRMTNG